MRKLPFSVLVLTLLLCPILGIAQPKLQLVQHAAGFVRPVDIAHCGDSRLFVVEQRGYIWVLDSLGNRLQDTFLNIDPRVRSSGNEQGLLGLAFPPDFAQSGLFYVNYTAEPDGATRVSRFRLKPGQANQADPDSEEMLLTQPQPYTNHNGGCLKFGPDGYLYIGLGDGGSGGDPQNNGQNPGTWLGKILRIDVQHTSDGLPYAIPADNPFVNDPAFRPEIWALGMRNPWRFSFDRLSGDLWIGDVGQSEREEVDMEPAHSGGGRNYGWRCYEGTFPYNTSGCQPASAYMAPVFDYDNNSVGCSVTGGFVYRGSQYPELQGAYLFTDYCSGRWWTIRRRPDNSFAAAEIADLANSQYSTLGEDARGELYVAALSQGVVYKIKELCSAFQISGTVTDATCAGALNGMIDLNISGGTPPYTFNWSVDQPDSLVVYLNPGVYTVQVQDANGCIRRDTFEVGTKLPLTAPEVIVTGWSAPLSQAALLCPGDTVWLEASEAPVDFGYQWYRDGQKVPNGYQRQLAAQLPGLYHVVHQSGLCSSPASASVEVAQSEALFIPNIQVQGPTHFCPGDSTRLQADVLPGFTLQWLKDNSPVSGATDPMLVVKTGGMYTARFERPGCDFPPAAPVQLVVENVPAPAVTVIGDTDLCADDSVRLLAGGAAAGWGYQWFNDGVPIPAAVQPLLVVSKAGAYAVRFTGGPCPGALSAAVQVNQSAPPVIERQGNSDILVLSGSYLSVQWVVFNYDTKAWDPIPGATDTLYNTGTEGLFAAQVVDFFGCTYLSNPIGIASTTLPPSVAAFQLAPNPSAGTMLLSIQLHRSQRLSLALRDGHQRTIFSQTHQGQRIEVKIDLQALPAGTYYLQVQLEDGGNFVRAVVRN